MKNRTENDAVEIRLVY